MFPSSIYILHTGLCQHLVSILQSIEQKHRAFPSISGFVPSITGGVPINLEPKKKKRKNGPRKRNANQRLFETAFPKQLGDFLRLSFPPRSQICMHDGGVRQKGGKGTVPEVVRVLRDQTKESLGLIAQNVVWPSRPFGFELQPFLGPHVLLLLLVLVYEEPLQ